MDKQPVIDPYTGGPPIGHPPPALWPEQDEGFDHCATIEWRRLNSPTLVHTARIRFSRPNNRRLCRHSFPALELFAATSRPDAAVVITGLTALGQSFLVPAGELENKFTEADDIVWTKGAHTLHLGASVVRLDSNVFYPFRSGSGGTFQCLANFLPGLALSVTATPAGSLYYYNRDYREIDSAPYLQDDWKVTSRLTLNLGRGLRWDFTTNPVAPHNTFIP